MSDALPNDMRVLVVEDHRRLADAVARGLRREGMAVDVSLDGVAALRRITVNPYDVIVLDRDLPALHGDEICRRLAHDHEPPRLLMLTAAATVGDRVEGLELGADDYLPKPFEFVELVARVRALGRRASPALPPKLLSGDVALDSSRRVAFRGSPRLELTPKEFGVLEYLLAAEGRVVPAEELLATGSRRHGWLRVGGRSARLRLTLLYSSMFLALGTTLIVIIFIVGSSGTPLDAQSVAVAQPTVPGVPDIHDAVLQQHSADLSRLLAGAWLTLALTAGVSALGDWFVAGRVLRPLREMTTTARTITAGNLDQRLALSGPDDEFRRLGDTIDDLLARLEASFAAQRRFVANAAHELRTPLTVERTLVQVALADPAANAETLRETCAELLEASREHELLLESLLTLATSERGLERSEPFELGRLVDAELCAAEPRIRAAQLELSSSLVPAVVSGDRALLERLVANLIDNAISYNCAGGRIEIRVDAGRDRAVLTVTNTGQHVPPADIERLFEPFRRQRADRERNEDGHHGLGLSIVHATAAAHHAAVTAAPGPDGGLTITVTFPPATGRPDCGAEAGATLFG